MSDVKAIVWASTNMSKRAWCAGFTTDMRKVYGDEFSISFTDGESTINFSRDEWEQILKVVKNKWVSDSQNSTNNG